MKTSKDFKNLVALAIKNHTPEELATGFLCYETLRKVSPAVFSELNRRNLAGENFDEIIKRAVATYDFEKHRP